MVFDGRYIDQVGGKGLINQIVRICKRGCCKNHPLFFGLKNCTFLQQINLKTVPFTSV
jgi:hypothetical protein